MSIRRALFLTNHFFAFAGSELTIVEMAEELQFRGWDCKIKAAIIGSPLGFQTYGRGIEIGMIDSLIDVSDFDLVWCQHGSLANIDFNHLRQSARRPFIVSVHLSPYTPMEKLFHPYENELADLIVANSEETAGSFPEWLDRDRTIVSNNPAPRNFFFKREHRSSIKKLLCVTNHLAAELSHVLLHFERDLNVDVVRIGWGGEIRRVKPEDIMAADVVISMGKTVQYALASRTPVYLYDHFGGEGWVLSDNLKQLAEFNFSGRPYCVKRSSDDLKADLLSGYEHAIDDSGKRPEEMVDAFRADGFVDRLLEILGRDRKPISFDAQSERVMSGFSQCIEVLQKEYRSKFGVSGNSIWEKPSSDRYF